MVFSTYNTFLSRVQLTILLSSSIAASLQDIWILFTLIHFKWALKNPQKSEFWSVFYYYLIHLKQNFVLRELLWTQNKTT